MATGSFAPGGRVVAVEIASRLEFRTLPAGELLAAVPDAHTPMFAADGTAVACSPLGRRIAVFDTATGRERARFVPEAGRNWPTPRSIDGALWPQSLSPDGALLSDSDNVVWDVATGRELYQLPAGVRWPPVWSPDGRSLIATSVSGRDSFVETFDAATGAARPGRRKVGAGREPGARLEPSADRRWVVACGESDPRQPTPPERWLSRVPGLGWLGQVRSRDVYEVSDADRGTVIDRGAGRVVALLPAADMMLRSVGDGEALELWDVPPRRPWRWMAVAVAAWTAAFALTVGVATWVTAWWRRRR